MKKRKYLTVVFGYDDGEKLADKLLSACKTPDKAFGGARIEAVSMDNVIEKVATQQKTSERPAR